MLRYLLFIVVIFGFSGAILAQGYTERKDLSKKEISKLKKAISASRSNDLDKANKEFDKILKKYPDFIELYLRKGSIYYQQKDYIKAKDNFLKAIAIDPEYDPEMYYSAGLALFEAKEYNAAAFHFESYLDRSPTNKRKEEKARKLMVNCKFIHKSLQNPLSIEFTKLPASINTEAREYGATESIDGRSLLFIRRYTTSDEILIGTKEADDYSVAPAFAKFDQFAEVGTFSISANGKFMVFTSCNNRDGYGGCDLFYSRKKNGQWLNPINMGPIINTPAWESQPSLSADGSVLFFSSNRKNGQGGKDIWLSRRGGERNGWTTPINLGKNINTKDNEESPFIHADGYTLYYQSNGLPGMGDYDNYFATRDGDFSTWSKPVNMGYPINTIGHDGAMTVTLDGAKGYISSDREFLDHKETNTNLEIFTFPMPDYAKPILTTYLKVNIIDAVTKAALSTDNIQLLDIERGRILSNYIAEEGEFITSLPKGKSYGLSIGVDDYLFQSRYFDLHESKSLEEPYVITVEMVPIPKPTSSDIVYDTPVILNNVFFETGSAKLKDISMLEIDRLSSTLLSKPSLKIKILGHTDNVGNKAANKKLSEDRAISVYNALIAKGVNASRLTYQGLGEDKPIDSNDTEQGRQRNRRTEFILIR